MGRLSGDGRPAFRSQLHRHASVRRVFASADHFDARTDSREFTVVMSDHATTGLGPALAAQLRDAAPAVHLRV
jgi:hypothetical protein